MSGKVLNTPLIITIILEQRRKWHQTKTCSKTVKLNKSIEHEEFIQIHGHRHNKNVTEVFHQVPSLLSLDMSHTLD